MNARLFRLVFSPVLGMLVPACERARARGKVSRGSTSASVVLRATLTGLSLLSSTSWAQAPAGLVPHPTMDWANAAIDPARTTASLMTIQQSQARAILNWQHFNLNNGESVVFDQNGNTSWAVLNQIWDANPSVIRGAISAPGAVYLINQNGILFGNGAQINVGSLTASALNVNMDAFNRGLLSLPLGQAAFEWGGSRQQFEASMIQIDAGARLQTSTGGRIMVLAPKVVNNGHIATPEGQTIVAAGSKVFLTAPLDTTLRGFLVEVDPYVERDAAGSETVNVPGVVTNDTLGQIVAERGNVTLASFAVNQMGRVSATTSVRLNGSVMLLARDSVSQGGGGIATVLESGVEIPRGVRTGRVVTGANSVTEVRAETGDGQTTQDSQGFVRSAIEVLGRNIEIRSGARVLAAGGTVKLTAQAGQVFQEAGSPAVGDVRIYVDRTAVIDVSGTTGTVVPMERNFIEVELRGNELRDAPLQRNGPLRGETVTVDIRKGTPLADISGYLGQVARSVGERTAAGGSVTLRSEGDVILREGSLIDVSGGSVNYAAGIGTETRLLGADGRTYAMSEADPDRLYAGFADRYTVTNARWNVTQIYERSRTGTFQPGYLEGKSAGTVSILAHGAVMDGDMLGSVATGPYQRTPQGAPAGGQLILGDAAQGSVGLPDFKLPDLAFVNTQHKLSSDFDVATSLASPWAERVQIPVALMTRGGFTRIAAHANGAVTIPEDVSIRLAPGGSIAVRGRSIDVAGDVIVPAGTIDLQTRETLGSGTDPAAFALTVRAGVTISTAGTWVNDSATVRSALGSDPIASHGGSISLRSHYDLTLDAGTIIDVSGGGYVDRAGHVVGGNGGSITLASGRLPGADRQQAALLLGGELRGWSLTHGGSLAITASQVTIGGQPQGGRGEFHLAPQFFAQGGFTSYDVVGVDGLTVSPGVTLAPVAQTLVLRPEATTRPSGSALHTLTVRTLLPAGYRPPVDLTLGATSGAYGTVLIGEGSTVRVDPTGSITLEAGRSITVLGTIDAPAGHIALTNAEPTTSGSYEADISLWLGANSRLLARGSVDVRPDAQGFLSGEVLSGGSVTLSARKGYIVTEVGSLIDVSGTVGALDVPTAGARNPVYVRTLVASEAGSVTLGAREGMLLDGSMRAQGGNANQSGGTLTVLMDQPPQAFFPGNPKRIVLAELPTFLSDGLQPGQPIDADALTNPDAPINGRAFVALSMVRDGGFDALRVKAQDAIEMQGPLDLSLRQSIEFDAPVVRALDDGVSRFAAGYVALGNTAIDRQAFVAPTTGAATLALAGRLIDVIGTSTTQGFGAVHLQSAGDVRMRAVVVDVDPNPSVISYGHKGALNLAGHLTIEAAQVYPTTFSDFTVALSGLPGGTVRIVSAPGAVASPVLSAGGKLTIDAPVIVQDGVLKAPFGELALRAGTSLALSAGSVTSVSGEGALIPFGRTELSGSDYVYALGLASIPQAVAPEKRVRLDAPSIDVAGVVDLSGGGDLYAYEFTPGPGGSRDVLDPVNSPDSFAIVPSIGNAFAPHDLQYWLGTSGLGFGEEIALSGVRGLPDGSYTVLPARYALLPGAFLVTKVDGYRDVLSAGNVGLPDGSQIVAGTMLAKTLSGAMVGDTRSSGFLVQSASIVRTLAEYTDVVASQFFRGTAGAQLPADAGLLSIAATQTLALGGSVRGGVGSGGRGAELDVTAPKLAVVADGAAFDAGYVVLSVESLNRLGAASILLGGTRSRAADGGIRIVAGVGAGNSEVIIANDASSALVAPEVMLAASGSITLRDGATIRASGRGGSAPGSIAIDGNGAFLRASSGSQATVFRSGFDRSEGVLDVGVNSTIFAANSVILDATRNTQVAESADLAARAIAIAAGRVSLGEVPQGTEGLIVTPTLLQQLSLAESLGIKSYSSIDFHGVVALGRVDPDGTPELGRLALDAAGIGGYGTGAKTVRAGELVWLNSSGDVGNPFASVPDGIGLLDMSATRVSESGGLLVLGAGAKQLAGFSGARLAGERAVLFEGVGALNAAGPLTLDGGVITTSTGAAQSVMAAGELGLFSSTTDTAYVPTSLGGQLQLEGARVVQAARIVLPSGQITLSATGPHATDGIELRAGSLVDVAGRAVQFTQEAAGYSAGGKVMLRATSGDVVFAPDATINIGGASAGGDGGRLTVDATQGRFLSRGTLLGAVAGSARGAAFLLDTGRIDAFTDLNGLLNAGGFSGERVYRVRTGDLTVAATDTVVSRSIRLVADGGNVDIAGLLDARGSDGGQIEVWALGNVIVQSSASLDASATSAAGKGGRVTLGTSGGELDLQAGARISAGGNADGRGGQILLRAPRTADDVAIRATDATFVGASAIVAEAFRVYDLPAAGASQFSTIAADNDSYMANAGTIRNRLAALTGLRTGVEIVSAGDLTLQSDWNLAVARPGGEAGVLTLRAAGNLVVNGSLNDGFATILPATGTPQASAITPLEGPSWSYRLVGGADTSGADPLALAAPAQLGIDSGDVRLAANKFIRTGDGFIDVAAGRSISLTNERSVIYTAGVPGPSVIGFENGHPPRIGGQSAFFTERGGDIRIVAQQDIVGAPSNQLISEWLYRDIRRDGSANPGTAWWVRFSDFRQGIGALGGGDITLTAGRDIVDVSAVVPTNGRLGGDASGASAIGNLVEQGGGDLKVLAGGDVSGGLFYVQKGSGLLAADGSIGSSRELAGEILHTLLAAGAATFDVRAGGDVTIESVFNPTALRQAANNTGITRTNTSYFFTYEEASSVSISSLAGTAVLANNASLLGQLPGTFFTGAGANETATAVVYPGTVRVAAFTGDVQILRPFTLFPSATGNLELLADGSVSVGGLISMSDVLPEVLPRVTAPDQRFAQLISQLLINASEQGALFHSDPILHRSDATPIRIVARTGDVTGPVDPDAGLLPFGVFPKSARIVAGRDVRNVWMIGQNVRSTDVTLVEAGRDVRFDTLRDPAGNQRSNSGRFELGGEGELQINAGRNIDLGNALGVVTRGNLNNPFLPESGAAIRLSTGGTTPDYDGFIADYLESPVPGTHSYLADLAAYMRARLADPALGETEALAVFKVLPRANQTEFVNRILFAELKATGRAFTAGQIDSYDRGYRAIEALYPGDANSYAGDLNLFFSQLKTEQGGDIEMRTPGGLVNAGLANPGNLSKPASELGIVTARGGSIRSFVHDDFLVNQSRVFTLQGGDILLWSSEGNIDAGKGAKTATATPPPQVVIRGDRIILDTSRSVEGSGIGVLLAREGVAPGDVDLIAPKGEVNAGDAGIRVAGNLNIAALRVIGAENIQVGGVSAGVPVTASASVGGLAGTTNVAQEASKSVQQATEQAAQATESSREAKPSFLTVEVIGLGDDDDERKRKR